MNIHIKKESCKSVSIMLSFVYKKEDTHFYMEGNKRISNSSSEYKAVHFMYCLFNNKNKNK